MKNNNIKKFYFFLKKLIEVKTDIFFYKETCVSL